MKLKTFFLKSIDFYQKNLSLFKRKNCVFYPTCSEYAKQATERYGILKGSFLGLRRILRCHPWQRNHLDPLQ